MPKSAKQTRKMTVQLVCAVILTALRLHACRHLIRHRCSPRRGRLLRGSPLALAPNCDGMPERGNLRPSSRLSRWQTVRTRAYPPGNHPAECLKLLEPHVRNITVHREINEPIATFSRDRLVTARPRWRSCLGRCLELEAVRLYRLFVYSLNTSCIFRYLEGSRAVLKSGRAGVSCRKHGGFPPNPLCKDLKFRIFAISSLYIL